MAQRPAPPVPTGRGARRDMPSDRASRPKPRIGQYVIERTSGTGSFGKVKSATHAITGHQVALKFINKNKITSRDMKDRVKREIQYSKVLRHPHIIKSYEVLTTPTDVIMVMEYAGEESFNYIVAKGKGGMKEDEARRFFQQMICAIEYCHVHHIVHRDSKPENSFLDNHNNIKIGDFGSSNLMTDGDFLKTSCGSPNYAAPEVISGKLYSGPEIDVWSAGVIMYVLLCGKSPFDDDHIPSSFKKIESGIYHMPSHISKEAQHVLRRMLVVDPVKRATIAEIRNMPFFLENSPAYLQPSPPTPMIERYPTIPMDDSNSLSSMNESGGDPKQLAAEKGYVFTEDLGVIDPSIVKDSSAKITTYTEPMVWEESQKPGDNQVKVAYQLVRDHRRVRDSMQGMNEDDHRAMENFSASSPPAWNAEFNSTQPNEENGDVDFEDEDDPEIQDIPNAHFDVLDSSSPGRGTPASGEGASQVNAERAAAASSPQQATGRPPQKPRWHFGIRSRSPPMEVMLEIYKTLQSLGMEWKVKENVASPEIGPPPPGGYGEEVEDVSWAYKQANPDASIEMGKRPPGKKEAAATDKQAQGSFFVETRARYRDVMVRMDSQSYRVDDHNYLVDFRNVGYYPIEPKPQQPEEVAGTPAHAGSVPQRDVSQGHILGHVSGPFHFLEMACQLIAESAADRDGAGR